MTTATCEHPSFLAPTHGPGLELEVARLALLAVVQAVDPVAVPAAGKPMYQNLLLTVHDDGSFQVSATDGQVGVRAVSRGATVRECGSVVVPARQLSAILDASVSPSVGLRVQTQGDAAVLAVSLADGDYTLPVCNDAFPPIDGDLDPASTMNFAAEAFFSTLERVAWAAEEDRISGVLSGIRLEREGSRLCMAATDGKVLVESFVASTNSTDAPAAVVILPRTTASLIGRLGRRMTASTLDLSCVGDRAVVRIGSGDGVAVTITSRLIQGSYPAYRMAFSALPHGTLVVDRTACLDALRRTVLIAPASPVVVDADADARQAVLSPLQGQQGQARIRLAVELDHPSRRLRLGVNPSYMRSVLGVIGTDRVTISVGRGLVMRDEASATTCLVMPISMPA